jgi:hypothetical protein
LKYDGKQAKLLTQPQLAATTLVNFPAKLLKNSSSSSFFAIFLFFGTIRADFVKKVFLDAPILAKSRRHWLKVNRLRRSHLSDITGQNYP